MADMTTMHLWQANRRGDVWYDNPKLEGQTYNLTEDRVWRDDNRSIERSRVQLHEYPYRITVPRNDNAADIEIKCSERWHAISEFAVAVGLGHQLQRVIDRLSAFARVGYPVELLPDFAPGSFTFRATGTGLFGGVIYHPDSREWSIHT